MLKFNFFNPQVTDNPVSSLTMLIICVIILSLQDSLIKYMASETSFWQLQFIRSIGNIILLFLIAKLTNGIDILFPIKWKPVYLRALTMTTCMFCFFESGKLLKCPFLCGRFFCGRLRTCMMVFTVSTGTRTTRMLAAQKDPKVAGFLGLRELCRTFSAV